jgi:predicted transposase YbfD/YdcC
MQTSEKPGIIDHFASVTDPRILLKTKHKLIDIIVITLCAVLAGADDWTEIADFGQAKEQWFRTFLGLPNGIPSHDTFGRVFSKICPDEFQKCFLNWVRDAFQNIAPQVIAIDGKTLRHSYDRESNKAAIHMVSAWATENRLVLGQVKTEEKSNEITAIPELLKVLALKGCIVTIDAMGCQKEIVKQIAEQKADYVICLKGNQGILHKEVGLLFQKAKENGFKDLSHDSYETVDGEHGRIEIRRYTTTGEVDWFEDKGKWKNLVSFGMVESERQVGDKTTHDTRYYISSLPSDAKAFAQAARGHWGIENSLHWCLDIAFREDDSRVRKGNAAANLAVLRHVALNLVKQDKTRKVGVKASRKRAGWDDSYMLHLLGL